MIFSLNKMLLAIKKKLVYIIRSCSVLLKSFYCILINLLVGKNSKPQAYPNRDIVLLGNGPSVNNLDLIKISQRYDIACVNMFAIRVTSTFFEIKPKYYVLIDPSFFGMYVYLNESKTKNDIQNDINAVKEIFNSIDWDMELIIPQGRSFAINNRHILIRHVPRQELYSEYLTRYLFFLYRRNIVSCGMQTVLTGALFYFLVNRFRTVYLGGADMSEFMGYKINEDNHTIMNSPHFYGTRSFDCAEAGVIPIGDFYMHLGFYAKMLKEFHILKEFADFQGVKVFNLSLDSYIDSFVKIDWKKIIKE